MSLKKITTLILILLIATSCGSGKKAQTNFSIKAGALVNGPPLDGGVYLHAINADGLKIEFDIGNEHYAVIPFGTWALHFVGYGGAGLWSGTTYCGSAFNVVLEEESANITIDLDQLNCSNEPYLSMINQKQASLVATWDNALWDTGTWSP